MDMEREYTHSFHMAWKWSRTTRIRAFLWKILHGRLMIILMKKDARGTRLLMMMALCVIMLLHLSSTLWEILMKLLILDSYYTS